MTLIASIAGKKERLDRLRPFSPEALAKLEHYCDLEITLALTVQVCSGGHIVIFGMQQGTMKAELATDMASQEKMNNVNERLLLYTPIEAVRPWKYDEGSLFCSLPRSPSDFGPACGY